MKLRAELVKPGTAVVGECGSILPRGNTRTVHTSAV